MVETRGAPRRSGRVVVTNVGDEDLELAWCSVT